MTDTPRTDTEPTYYRNSEDGNMEETYGSGDWVTATDYKKLQAKLAETKQLLVEARGRLVHVKGCSVLDFKGDCSCGLAELRTRIDEAIKESK